MLAVDADKLIKAVKSRPALYNKNDSMYNHRKHKERLWREVCIEVQPKWESMKPVEKVEWVQDVQKRWKSLRTCFTRELTLQRKERFKEENSIPVKKRKKYGHFAAMTFLLGDNPEQFDVRESDQECSDPLDATYDSGDIEYNFDSQTEPINISNIVPEYGMPVYDNKEEFESKVLNVMKECKKRDDDDDDDKHFMMSLVPMFRKLTDKQKIKARIEMMQIVQRSLEENDA